MTAPRSKPRPFTFALAGILALSCASIPPEAPELSGELGQRIQATRDAHLVLLHGYFDERRSRVDEIVRREWTPRFAREVFGKPAMIAAWDSIVASNDPVERLKFITLVGPRIVERIEGKVREHRVPLDELERALERRLREEYAQALAINNSLTSFLASAAEVEQARARYLETFGIARDDVSGVIDRVDAAVDRIARLQAEGESIANETQTFVRTLNALARLIEEPDHD